MNGLRLKPDLSKYFAAMPAVGMWIEFDYNNATTLDEMSTLVHKWIGIAETTDNLTKRSCYQSAANYVYSWLTGKSFDSTNFKSF